MKTRALVTATALLAGVSLLTLPAQAQSAVDVRRACESLMNNPSESRAEALFGTSIRFADDFCDDRGFNDDDDDGWRDDDWDDDDDRDDDNDRDDDDDDDDDDGDDDRDDDDGDDDDDDGDDDDDDDD